MAALPDPTATLTPDERAAFDHMARARAHAEGRAELGEVYVKLFNHPDVAEKIGALGEQLRFHGVLPDAARELIILRYAFRQGYEYEWAHHQRPARLAGLGDNVIAALRGDAEAFAFSPLQLALLAAVDAVVAKQSIPDQVQRELVTAYGVKGVVELVALCGLYGIMGYAVTAFDIGIEASLSAAPTGQR